MSYQSRITIAILATLGFSALNEAAAQPVVPMRPTYGTYGGFFGYGRGNYYSGNNSFGFQNNQLQAQNFQLQQQLNQTNQNIASLQSYLLSGVDPNLPITGHGATFGYYGHWYYNSPTSSGGAYGGGTGGFAGGGVGYGPRLAGAATGTGGKINGTSGAGIPIGPVRTTGPATTPR